MLKIVGFRCEKMTILTAVERGLCVIFQTSRENNEHINDTVATLID